MTMTANNQQIVPVPKAEKPEAKSWAMTFVDRAKSELKSELATAPPAEPMEFVRGAGSAVVEYTEGGVVGALLGTAHARFGLDGQFGPGDGWVAALGAVLGVALSGHFPSLAARARGAGAKAFTVLAFRKSFELVSHEPLAGRVSGGVQRLAIPGRGPGVTKIDPIEEVAAAVFDKAEG